MYSPEWGTQPQEEGAREGKAREDEDRTGVEGQRLRQ